ncbi:MAG: pseudouridine-5'-phosphate glycosidase [Phycisphaerales bacterium]|nr:pseudouridine-5'-phosphate glycosidase [Phycisphaerales bacterium]
MHVHPEVAEALQDQKPVVLLETAVLTHGLPRLPWQTAFGDAPNGIDSALPVHLATMQCMEQAVRGRGAVPAITAVIAGVPHLGISPSELEALAENATTQKASASTLGQAIASHAYAGTTVSGTLRIAAAITDGPVPRVFATGGIGGVHFGWNNTPDISADLGEMTRHEICVVCAGAKSIIDPVATMETLETLGIPVLGLKTDRLPRFQAAGDLQCPRISQVESVHQAASIATAHWSLPGGAGVLLMQAPPSAVAMSLQDVEQAVQMAESSVCATGQERTPALLQAMAESTSGASLRVNIALLESNASTAADLALALC